jgi:hypothetical protein
VQDSTIGQQGRELGLQQAKLTNHSVQLGALQSQNDQQEGKLGDLTMFLRNVSTFFFIIIISLLSLQMLLVNV